MYAFMAALFFGCFIVSLTLAPEAWKIPFAIASLILLVTDGIFGVITRLGWN